MIFKFLPVFILLLLCKCADASVYFPSDFLKQSKIDGNFRLYNFTQNFGSYTLPTRNSFSTGGRINYLSPDAYTFKGGLSFFGAESLDLNSTNFNHIDQTLPGRSINVLGQAFLQSENKCWLIRGGNQLINTPWLNEADSRMIPAAYQGILATLKPWKNIDITLLRIFRYKSRTSKSFNNTNLYNPNNFGGTGLSKIANIDVLGGSALGTHYKYVASQQELKTQAWYYKFYDFTNLAYADVLYSYRNGYKIEPFIGGQMGKAWSDGKDYLAVFNYGASNAVFYGATTGIEFPRGQITLGYDDIPVHKGAYQNGDIVSPYTSGYTADPLYTTSMIAGLIEKSSGYAYKLAGNALLFDKRLTLTATLAKYFTKPTTPNTTEIDMDMWYFFKNTRLKGLNIRYRLGILNGNPSNGRFLYNRLQVQYDF